MQALLLDDQPATARLPAEAHRALAGPPPVEQADRRGSQRWQSPKTSPHRRARLALADLAPKPVRGAINQPRAAQGQA